MWRPGQISGGSVEDQWAHTDTRRPTYRGGGEGLLAKSFSILPGFEVLGGGKVW